MAVLVGVPTVPVIGVVIERVSGSDADVHAGRRGLVGGEGGVALTEAVGGAGPGTRPGVLLAGPARGALLAGALVQQLLGVAQSGEIGSASGRGRVLISVVAVSLKKTS